MKPFNLSKGATYHVAREFTDFEGRVIPPGQQLTFLSEAFDVTSGYYLLVFRERKVRLREDAGRQIVEHLHEYLTEVPGSAAAGAIEGDGAAAGVRCPNCRHPMTVRMVKLFYQPHPVEVDACRTCNLLWFDRSECISMTARSVLDLFHYLGRGSMQPAMPLSRDPACARCSAPLKSTQDLHRGGRFTYWRCPHEHGELYTFSQFLMHKHFIRSPSQEDLAALKKLVRQISCSQCGAPVDLVKDKACSHCNSAITLVDPDGIAKAVQELSAAEAKQAAIATEAGTRAALIKAQNDSLALDRRLEQNLPPDLLGIAMSAIAVLLS